MRRGFAGGPPGMGPMWGPPGPPFMGRGRGRGPRARRGNVRAAILALVGERPMHGYEIIQQLEERSGGLWRASPGSIYPTLHLLEDEGLVTSEKADDKRSFSLTDAGRAEAERQASEKPPWEQLAEGADSTELRLRQSAFQVGMAAMQVAQAGSEEQVATTLDVLAETRRRIYAILAEE